MQNGPGNTERLVGNVHNYLVQFSISIAGYGAAIKTEHNRKLMFSEIHWKVCPRDIIKKSHKMLLIITYNGYILFLNACNFLLDIGSGTGGENHGINLYFTLPRKAVSMSRKHAFEVRYPCNNCLSFQKQGRYLRVQNSQ